MVEEKTSDLFEKVKESLPSDAKWRAVPPNHIVAFARGEAPRLFALTPQGQLADVR